MNSFIICTLHQTLLESSNQGGWKWRASSMGEGWETYAKFLEGKPGGKRPPKCRWESYINMDLKEIGYENFELICLAQRKAQWSALWTWQLTFGFH